LALLGPEAIDMNTRWSGVPESEFSWLSHKVVALNGIIAVGKTTLGRALEGLLNEQSTRRSAHFLAEKTPLLGLFAADPKANAFAFQMDQIRIAQNNSLRAAQERREGATVIVERDPAGNHVFCAAHRVLGNISEEQFRVYVAEMESSAPYSTDYEVLQWASPEECLRRLRLRGRAEENAISVEYLDLLDRVQLQLALTRLANGASQIVLLDCDRFVTPRDVLRALNSARLASGAFTIRGDPRHVFYTTVEQRREIVQSLANTRSCVIPVLIGS
jgi:deoxyadenosine/deoxycytidine kinase